MKPTPIRILLGGLALLVVAMVAWVALNPTARDAGAGTPTAALPADSAPATDFAWTSSPAGDGDGDYPSRVDPESLDPEAIASLRGAREFGDPRTPPIGRSEPREQATPEELADPEKYAEFEARQDRKLKRAYVVEAERYVAQLRSDIEKGRALGIPADEIAKVEEKVRRIEAMRAELLAADPALLDGAETPSE